MSPPPARVYGAIAGGLALTGKKERGMDPDVEPSTDLHDARKLDD